MINSTNKKRVELLVERSTKHGQAVRSGKSRTYMIWSSMVGRCTRPSDGSYKYYGAKGVTVCDRWRKFDNFFEDMGEAPDDSHIHRLNGATIYSKETCQWMSEKEHIGLHNTERGWRARLTRTELIDRVAGLQDELAAERQRRERDIRRLVKLKDDLVVDCRNNKQEADHYHQRLLSALAAIEHVRKREGCIVTDERLAQIIDNVDLSALREHDDKLTAEVRKPLVEIANRWPRVHAAIRSDIMLCEAAEEIAFMADVLAKVKEAK